VEGGRGLTDDSGLERQAGDTAFVSPGELEPSPAELKSSRAEPEPNLLVDRPSTGAASTGAASTGNASTGAASTGNASTGPLLPLDDARSPDSRVCPFFRLVDADGRILAPHDGPHPGNHCAAFGEPQPQSARQQDLVCLRSAHANCPRYLRGMLVEPRAIDTPGRSRFSRATMIAALVLLASAGASFGFVLQRGGIVLPLSAGSPAGTTAAASPVDAPVTAAPAASPAAAPTELSSSPSVTIPPATPPPATPPPTPGTAPPATPVPTPAATLAPTPRPATPPPATPAPTEGATASPTPGGSGVGTAPRYALLEPCPDAPSCWVYTVRPGDNLVSIVNWFGVPYDTVIAMNPGLGDPTTIQPGDRIRMPPPTR